MWASDILALNEVILLKSISVNERQRFSTFHLFICDEESW